MIGTSNLGSWNVHWSNEAQNIIQCPRSPPPAPSQVVGAAWGWAQSCWASSWWCFLGDVPIVLTVFPGFSWFLKWCFLDVVLVIRLIFGDFPGKCFLNGVSLVLAMIYTDSHWFSLMTCTDLHCLSLVHMFFFLNTALHWLSWIVLAGGWLSLFFFVRGEVRRPKWSDCHVLFIPFGKWGCWRVLMKTPYSSCIISKSIIIHIYIYIYRHGYKAIQRLRGLNIVYWCIHNSYFPIIKPLHKDPSLTRCRNPNMQNSCHYVPLRKSQNTPKYQCVNDQCVNISVLQ